MILYFQGIWRSRYFWLHLVLSDLRFKYRRSFLGIGWSILHPLFMTFLLSFVMGKMFHSSVGEYALYIFSGTILWEFIVSCANNGCNSLINAEGYIRQMPHPLCIYSLRVCLGSFINLILASVGLITWILLKNPTVFSLSWISLPLSLCLITLLGWMLATITAFTAVRFRDFSQLVQMLFQALWYVSPILFLPRLFTENHLSTLLLYNPIYHVLKLFRDPLLEGRFPSFVHYQVVLLTFCILALINIFIIKKSEKETIFHL